MLKVTVVSENGTPQVLGYDTTALDIRDGSLIVYESNAEFIVAGFAPGQWLEFEIVKGE